MSKLIRARITLGVGAAALGFLLVTHLPSAAQQNSSPSTSPPAAKSAAPAPSSSPQQAQQLTLPQPEVMLLMVRVALVALDQANKTGNYAVLHALGGPNLQSNSVEKLAEIFAPVRNANIDLQGTVVLTPQMTEPPIISPQGVLSLVGAYPTQPLQIQFQIFYQPVGGTWRLAGLSVSLVPVKTTAAPGAAPASAAAPTPSKKDAASPAVPAKK